MQDPYSTCMQDVFSDYSLHSLFRTEILDQSGQPLPLTFVLSPISLAANLRVDSIFSPSFVPLYSVSFICEEFNATLLHSYPGGDCPVQFDGYQVMPAAGPEGQELMRMGVRGGAIAVRQGREENVSVKVCMSVSVT